MKNGLPLISVSWSMLTCFNFMGFSSFKKFANYLSNHQFNGHQLDGGILKLEYHLASPIDMDVNRSGVNSDPPQREFAGLDTDLV